MQKIVGIRFREAGKIYYFDPVQIFLKIDDKVIAETARGLEYGTVASKVRYIDEEELKHPIKPIVRKATAKDTKSYLLNLGKADESLDICQQQVTKHKLQMKLIRAEHAFDGSKIIFYFTADGRIDFRELVKDLASIFKIRIELRQIGVRDEAKIIGGIGVCGRELCCNKWMGEFQTVSIKMAKEQGLSLNPSKISGICGRLLCCLKYEHECYEEALKTLPEVGDGVHTPSGNGYVLKINTLAQTVIVKLKVDDIIKTFNADEIKVLDDKKKKHNKNNNIDETVLSELKNVLKEDKSNYSEI